MARKVIHQLVDDLDDTVLEPGEGETVSFALDGKTYEIDLKSDNAQELRDALSKYIKAGRRASNTTPARSRTANSKRTDGVDLTAVRDWARKNRHTVSDRGRVPQTILDAYSAAN